MASAFKDEIAKITTVQTVVMGVAFALKQQDPEKLLIGLQDLFSNHEEMVIPLPPSERKSRKREREAKLVDDLSLLDKAGNF